MIMSEYSNYKYRTRPSLHCVVCSAAAFGMNFNASPYCFLLILDNLYFSILVTCQSCKAFFRRNALKPPVCTRDM